MSEKKISIKLTPKQAKILWNIVDGASDAGACEGGNTEEEAEALEDIHYELLRHHEKWKNVELVPG